MNIKMIWAWYDLVPNKVCLGLVLFTTKAPNLAGAPSQVAPLCPLSRWCRRSSHLQFSGTIIVYPKSDLRLPSLDQAYARSETSHSFAVSWPPSANYRFVVSVLSAQTTKSRLWNSSFPALSFLARMVVAST